VGGDTVLFRPCCVKAFQTITTQFCCDAVTKQVVNDIAAPDDHVTDCSCGKNKHREYGVELFFNTNNFLGRTTSLSLSSSSDESKPEVDFSFRFKSLNTFVSFLCVPIEHVVYHDHSNTYPLIHHSHSHFRYQHCLKS